MGKKADISEKKLIEIKTMILHTALSQRKIAQMANVSKSVVNRVSKKVKNNENLDSGRSGKCGRKRLTTLRDERKIRAICLKNRKKNISWLANEVQKSGITVSKRTVQRRLIEVGLVGHRPSKKPRLTNFMMRQRLQWARNHRWMTVEDWSQVCFSDESTFEILGDKSQFVRRYPGEELHPNCLVERIKHPTKVMVWSVISAKGMGRLYIVDGMMNQHKYLKVLETCLLPQLRDWFPNDENFIFMHDSAPCHKAKSVTSYLATKNIKVLPWPGNSPDMNPIENLWEFTKRKIAEEVLTNKRDLIEKLISIWHHSSELKQNAKKCIESMPQRIKAVIKAKGSVTKY